MSDIATQSNLSDEMSALGNQVDTSISESVCQLCGGLNPVWFAPNELWNSVIGNRLHFVCPNCFIDQAERQGTAIGVWRLGVENG